MTSAGGTEASGPPNTERYVASTVYGLTKSLNNLLTWVTGRLLDLLMLQMPLMLQASRTLSLVTEPGSIAMIRPRPRSISAKRHAPRLQLAFAVSLQETMQLRISHALNGREKMLSPRQRMKPTPSGRVCITPGCWFESRLTRSDICTT